LSIAGLIFQLAYRLRRHFCMGWSLARWLGILIGVASVWSLARWWPRLEPALALAGLFVGFCLFLGWASRRGFVDFRALPPGEALGGWPQPLPLRVEEMVPVRTSGWFTVEGRNQYYASVESDYETVETGEHIILGRVYPSRFLLAGHWPDHEVGWWYVFFEPAMIQELSVGRLGFGLYPSLALRVVYSADGQHRQTIYLAFQDLGSLKRVWTDLLKGAPTGAETKPPWPAPEARG